MAIYPQKIINAKIDELVYDEVYDQEAIDWLKNHPKGKKIKIRKYENSEGNIMD